MTLKKQVRFKARLVPVAESISCKLLKFLSY